MVFLTGTGFKAKFVAARRLNVFFLSVHFCGVDSVATASAEMDIFVVLLLRGLIVR